MTEPRATSHALFLQAMQAALSDELWQPFGFTRRPRWTGLLFRLFMKESDRTIEPALMKELYLMTQGVQINVASQLVGRSEALHLTAHLLQLVMRGPPGSNDLAHWTSFRLQDAHTALSHISAGLREYVATDGSAGQIVNVFRRHCPSPSVERRWTAGGIALASRYVSALSANVRQLLCAPDRELASNSPVADRIYVDCAGYIIDGQLPLASASP